MSVRFCKWLPVLFGIAAAGTLSMAAREGGGSGREDDSSAIGNNPGPVTAQARQTKAPVNRLLLLEERITRALKGISSGSSMESVAPRPPMPLVRHVAPSKKDIEERELMKNEWMLMSPEDFAEHEASLELRKLMRDGGILKGAGRSPESQLFKDLDDSAMGGKGLMDSLKGRDAQSSSDRQRDSTPAEVARSEDKLRGMLQERSSSLFSDSARAERGFSGFQGSAAETADRRKHDQYMDSYRQLMAPPVSKDFTASPLGQLATDPSRSSQPLQGGGFMDSGGNNPLGPQFGGINPVLSPRQPLNTTEQVLNQWNKSYTPSVVPPPRAPTPPKPSFEAPRRKF
jgi:hypothetical protein